MPYHPFTESHIPDLSDKRVIVTGANSGVGFETARILADHGASVIMAVRTLSKGQEAANQIKARHPHAQIEVAQLDVSDLASVRRFADSISALDILINNAGVLGIPFTKTADGFETQFATIHLGHFALTALLMPVLLAAPAARIITVGSEGHRSGKVEFDNLNSERKYDKLIGYCNAKLVSLMCAYELQRRLAAAGAPAISIVAHPGYAFTLLQTSGLGISGDRLSQWGFKIMGRIVGQPADIGALAMIYAAVAPDVRGGEYIGPTGFLNYKGPLGNKPSSKESYDQEVARRLWQISEELTNVQYSFEPVKA